MKLPNMPYNEDVFEHSELKEITKIIEHCYTVLLHFVKFHNHTTACNEQSINKILYEQAVATSITKTFMVQKC